MQVTGTITHIGSIEVVTEKFRKRTLVITREEEKYDKDLAIEFKQDYVDTLDAYSEGQEVTVKLNLSSRSHNDRWYTSASGWNIVATDGSVGVKKEETQLAGQVDDDNLPF